MASNFSYLHIQIFFVLLFYLKDSLQIDLICSPQDTCENCLSANLNCAWCTNKNFSSKPRCMIESDLLKSGCPTSQIIKNSPEFKILQNNELQDFQIDKPYAQLKPQKLKIKLIKSHTERLKMTFRPAENNPLDLYFLMDLTWTMRDDRETLINIGEQLANALKKLTKNFRLGFGSYADKPIMPIISSSTKSNPCIAAEYKCEPTYSFHHHLSLTQNINNFINKVNSSKITANLDNLEGGFDALMQVIVCNEQINWNNDARKIVILATNGFMHFAGDGLLAGIVQKNDKKCHLEKLDNNDYWEYTGSLDYDYPSLEEIYRELVKRKINVIFAVTEDVFTDYRQMWSLMKDVSEVGILKNDSSNILDLVKKGYESFIKRVQFKDNSPPYMLITYETDCGGIHEIKTKNYCDGLQIGKEIDFYVNITVKDFPNDEKYQHLIKIEESSLSEYLEIDVDIQKPCPCEEIDSKSLEDAGKDLCSNHGKFSCGMCKCDEGWLGTDCSCDSQNYTSVHAMEEKCRKRIEQNGYESLGLICSNQGECECGKCHCFQDYTGKYCECRECENCNDPERAECVCGDCVCKPGWSGDQCDCPEAVDSCIAPNGEVCTKHGKCKCGICECDDSYFGKFCEINPAHESKLCSYYEPCVKCLIEEKQKTNKCESLNEICSNGNDNKFEYEFVKEVTDSNNKCLIRLEKDGVKCDHFYNYDPDINGKSNIKIQINSCESFLSYLSSVGLIFFISTILIGALILFAVRIFFYIKDRREYAKFEQEIQQQSFEMQSPLYKSPITHYFVPKTDEDD